MSRDALFYELFRDVPRTLFELIGRSAEEARHYRMVALELKESAVRLDGLFEPVEGHDGPMIFWEAQYYRSDKFYANLIHKVFRYLDHAGPRAWLAVVIYPSRSKESPKREHVQSLIDTRQLIRVFVNELPPAQPDQPELAVLELLNLSEDRAPEHARRLVDDLKKARRSKRENEALIEFVLKVMVQRFTNLPPEEIKKMLNLTDYRKTRFYQSALEEGESIGLAKGKAEGESIGLARGKAEGKEEVALNLLRAGMTTAEVSRLTGLPLAHVKRLAKSI